MLEHERILRSVTASSETDNEKKTSASYSFNKKKKTS